MEDSENEIENDQVQKPKKSIWRRVFIFLLIVFVAAVYVIFRLSNTPSSAKNITVKTSSIAESKPVEFERFEGVNLSFRHSTDYEMKRHQDVADENSGILETAFFATNETSSKKIALTVESLKGRTMEESANYLMRMAYPDRYSKENFSAEGQTGIAFAAKEGTYEKVVFISKNSILVEIALSANYLPEQKYDDEVKDIVASIQWKNDKK